MTYKSYFFIGIVAMLPACGGGGANSEFSPANISILWESPRGTGFGLIRATSDEHSAVALVEDVDKEGRGFSSLEFVEVISEQENSDGSLTGEFVVRDADGVISNVIGTFYVDDKIDARLYVRVSDSGSLTVASGSNVSNLPIGTYSYSGIAKSLYFYNDSFYEENGQFNMDVQFGSQTAQLTADTKESRYINNNLVVNNKGEISGIDGTFTVYDIDGTTPLETRNIDFDGTFHGSGATHVSGIAVGGATTTNDYSEMGIVGKR